MAKQIRIRQQARLGPGKRLVRKVRSFSKGSSVPIMMNLVADNVLGEGGFGTVYLMHQNPQNPIYKAVKLISPKSEVGRRELDAVVREEAKMASIIGNHHPYIVVPEYSGTLKDGTFYMVFPFIKGPTLAELNDEHIDKGRLLPVDLTAWYFHRILSGLSDVHNHRKGRFAHRDLSPTNIIVQQDTGIPKILDWGCANDVLNGNLVGKPEYLAPEIIERNGKLESHEYIPADIFSLGVIIREMLVGKNALKTPENEEYSFDYRQKMDLRKIIPVHELCKDVPETFSRIVEICMSPNPKERPSSADLYDWFGKNYLYAEGGFGLTAEASRDYLEYFYYNVADNNLGLGADSFGKNLAKIISCNKKTSKKDLEYVFGNVSRTFEDAFGNINPRDKADIHRYYRREGLEYRELEVAVNTYLHDSILKEGQFKE